MRWPLWLFPHILVVIATFFLALALSTLVRTRLEAAANPSLAGGFAVGVRVALIVSGTDLFGLFSTLQLAVWNPKPPCLALKMLGGYVLSLLVAGIGLSLML